MFQFLFKIFNLLFKFWNVFFHFASPLFQNILLQFFSEIHLYKIVFRLVFSSMMKELLFHQECAENFFRHV